MCGLTGIISSRITDQDRKAFAQLFHVSQLRGKHSSGVLSIGSGGKSDSYYYKRAIPPTDFLQLNVTKDLILNGGTALLGHARHATMGAHTDDNAHPFVIGNIVFFHNGTLTNHHTTLVGKPANSAYMGTDSEILGNALQSHSNTKEVLESIEGAYALMWWDRNTNTIHFARNTKRTFYIARGEDSLYVSSEKEMLNLIIARKEITGRRLKALPTGVHYKQCLTTVEGKLPPPETSKFKPKISPQYSVTSGYAYDYSRGYGSRLPKLNGQQTEFIPAPKPKTKVEGTGITYDKEKLKNGIMRGDEVLFIPLQKRLSGRAELIYGLIHRWGVPAVFGSGNNDLKVLMLQGAMHTQRHGFTSDTVAFTAVARSMRGDLLLLTEYVPPMGDESEVDTFVAENPNMEGERCDMCNGPFFEGEAIEATAPGGRGPGVSIWHTDCADELTDKRRTIKRDKMMYVRPPIALGGNGDLPF